MKIRKSVIALAAGLPFVAGSALAATPFQGPYVGGQIGYSAYDLEISAPGLSVDGISATGAEGGIYGGWGMKFSPVTYGGIEAEYNWSGAEHTSTLSDLSGTIEDTDNYGISGRVGWLPSNNVMLYGRLGWQRATLDYGGSEQDHDGLRVGLGAEVAMAGDWLLRMDYAHTMYDDVTVGGLNLEPENDVFRVGFARQF